MTLLSFILETRLSTPEDFAQESVYLGLRTDLIHKFFPVFSSVAELHPECPFQISLWIKGYFLLSTELRTLHKTISRQSLHTAAYIGETRSI